MNRHDQLEISRISMALRRRWLWLLLGVAAITLAAYFGLRQWPDSYRAEAQILLEAGARSPEDEAAVLRSRLLAAESLTQLRRQSTPAHLAAFGKRLRVETSGDNSHMLTLRFYSTNPRFAAEALNTLLAVYLAGGEAHTARTALRLQQAINTLAAAGTPPSPQVLETLHTRYYLAQAERPPFARVLSPASVPEQPFAPKRLPVLLAAMVLAFIGVGGLCVLKEYSVVGYQSTRHLEWETGIPGVLMLPESRDRAKESNHLHLLNPVRAPLYAEAVRALRGLVLSRVSRVLLVCSCLPEEGKSATALSLAVALQQTGRRVLLLDGDLRRSQLAKSLQISKSAGLAQYLAGEAGVHDIIHKDPETGLHFIPAGQAEGHPLDLLESKALDYLFAIAQKDYDMVVVDAPPLLSVQDAEVLAPYATSCLMLVRFEKTPRAVVEDGLHLLRRHFAPERLMLALSRVEALPIPYPQAAKDYQVFTNYAFEPAGKPDA